MAAQPDVAARARRRAARRAALGRRRPDGDRDRRARVVGLRGHLRALPARGGDRQAGGAGGAEPADAVRRRVAAHRLARRRRSASPAGRRRSPPCSTRYSRAGARTLAITNDPDSPLAHSADCVASRSAPGEEGAVPATKTFTAQLAALALVAEALGPVAVEAGRLGARAGRGARRCWTTSAPAERAAERLDGAEELVALGRGYLMPVALEAALKLREAAGLRAEGWSAADFRHGPVTVAGADLPVLAVSAAGPAAADVGRARPARSSASGATVLRLADDAGADLPYPGRHGGAAARAPGGGARPAAGARGGPAARGRPRLAARPAQGHADALSASRAAHERAEHAQLVVEHGEVRGRARTEPAEVVAADQACRRGRGGVHGVLPVGSARHEVAHRLVHRQHAARPACRRAAAPRRRAGAPGGRRARTRRGRASPPRSRP